MFLFPYSVVLSADLLSIGPSSEQTITKCLMLKFTYVTTHPKPMAKKQQSTHICIIELG